MSMLDENLKVTNSLSLRAIIPGLFLILLVDALAFIGMWPSTGIVNLAFSLVLLVLPWATLVVTRKSVTNLGYQRAQALRALGWGMVAGGLWRITSILINLSGIKLGYSYIDWISPVLGAIVWVPLVEETYFRGYIGRTLSTSIGLWPGIVAQALLFTLQPVHLSQGLIALISVFGFGVIAGWIQNRFDSIWAAWGAHAFANVLPLLILFA
jgi:membrane protease YdiL (CAAX protease family)